jgi:hypothetical protein
LDDAEVWLENGAPSSMDKSKRGPAAMNLAQDPVRDRE